MRQFISQPQNSVWVLHTQTLFSFDFNLIVPRPSVIFDFSFNPLVLIPDCSSIVWPLLAPLSHPTHIQAHLKGIARWSLMRIFRLESNQYAVVSLIWKPRDERGWEYMFINKIQIKESNDKRQLFTSFCTHIFRHHHIQIKSIAD